MLDRHAVEIDVQPRRPGRSRRHAVVAVLVVLSLALAVLLALMWHGKASDPLRGGYPQRIGFDRPSEDLPARPGALAATLYDNDFGAGRALGVTSGGRLWELPGGGTALSPSGARLLVLPWGESRRPFVQDLVTGDRSVLPAVVGHAGWGSRAAVHWSPDETALLLTADPDRARHRRAVVVDLTTGTVRPVGDGAAAGYRSAGEVVSVRVESDGGIVATTTDLGSGDADELALGLGTPWRGDPGAALVASVAPDGRTLLLVEVAPDQRPDATIRLFSLLDGHELPPRSVRDWDGCAPGWVEDDPVLPTSSVVHGSSRAASAMRLTADGPERLVAVHPRLQSSCLQLTTAALEAGPRWSLFGTSTALWTWYWFPALVVLVTGVVAVVVLVRSAAGALRAGAGRSR